MLVSTISPAPSCSTSRAQATASRPVPLASAVDVDFPDLAAVLLHPLGVDIDHDALAAEPAGRLADEFGVVAAPRS